MFKKITLVIILLSLTLSACTINGYPITINTDRVNGSGKIVTQEREVSDIDKVDLQSVGNLTIVMGDHESLTITADDNLMDYITTDVFNGTLEIGMKPHLSVNPSRTIEYLLTVKSLSSITLSGYGNIDAEELSGEDVDVKLSGSGNLNIGTFKSENALLRVAGFGDIKIQDMVVDQPTLEITGSGDINVDKMQAVTLSVNISGFGNADIIGSAKDQNVQILGSGNYHGQDLKSETAEVKITGFGNGTIWATDSLDVTITGSGNLEYYGNPKITQTMTGFGKINSLGDH